MYLVSYNESARHQKAFRLHCHYLCSTSRYTYSWLLLNYLFLSLEYENVNLQLSQWNSWQEIYFLRSNRGPFKYCKNDKFICENFQPRDILGNYKVIYPKYSNHWLSTVAHTIDCVCSKILNQGLNHGLLFSLFMFFGWKNILN